MKLTQARSYKHIRKKAKDIDTLCVCVCVREAEREMERKEVIPTNHFNVKSLAKTNRYNLVSCRCVCFSFNCHLETLIISMFICIGSYYGAAILAKNCIHRNETQSGYAH